MWCSRRCAWHAGCRRVERARHGPRQDGRVDLKLAAHARIARLFNGGQPDSDLDTNPSPPRPPPLGVSKMLRWSGPHLAPTWRCRRRKCFFLTIRWGVKFCFRPMCVYSKCSEFYGEFKYASKHEFFLEPLTFPTPPTQPFKSGCWDRIPQGLH